jgi:hypothetical protein
MATVKHQFVPQEATFPATAFAQYKLIQGTSSPVPGLFFDAATDEAAFWRFIANNYGSGNLTLKVLWYADTATSGNIIWEAQIAAITPDTDTQDIETDALATATNVTDSHLATTGQRLHQCTITISNLDSIAADDHVVLRVARDANNASDTMTGDAVLVGLELTYSDT